jgi:L-ascorbate metabolism protein UlaG (beta-lactamase superfamily)
MMRRRLIAFGFAAAALSLAASPGRAEAHLEYIAHACFAVESPAGVRVVIDPYNSNRWMGYHFPSDVPAKAVLISHPHYDHDASYYWPVGVPVFREPGQYSVGDIRVTGIEGRHAGPYGAEFGQKNTIWLVETGGVRIAHLGDNGPLTPSNYKALGRVDVLLTPADDLEHILTSAEIGDIRAKLSPKITIPMHYRLEALTELPDSLGPVSAWLGEQKNVERLESNRLALSAGSLGNSTMVIVPQPSPKIEPWRESLHQAFALRTKARALLEKGEAGRDEAIGLLRRASELAPDSMLFSYDLASALAGAGSDDGALGVLEIALSAGGGDDWEYTELARDLLAGIHLKRGNTARAAQQYRLILQQAHRTELIRRARAFLEKARGQQ